MRNTLAEDGLVSEMLFLMQVITQSYLHVTTSILLIKISCMLIVHKSLVNPSLLSATTSLLSTVEVSEITLTEI